MWTIEESLDELEELSRTAGLDVQNTVIQNLDRPHISHYVGKGKLEEIRLYVCDNDITVIVTDDELTPAQHKNLEKTFQAKVLDRTALILEIFAQRAQTYEAQLQVELAQLEYMMPRLTNLWTHLSRQGGGIGSKGPGERQLEVDKRQVRKRMLFIKEKLKKVQQHRQTQRSKRDQIPMLTGAIIGYTNAGKSTLMNRLTSANVLEEDKLFATLDPTTRKFTLPSQETILITDTVGFIQKLPHHLVKAFYSTLEVATVSDFIIHVLDASHPNILGMIKTSQEILKDLDADTKPVLYVLNKWDKVIKPNTVLKSLEAYTPYITISALTDKSFTSLLEGVQDLIAPFMTEFSFNIPYTRMDLVNLLHENGTILEEVFEESIKLRVKINAIIGNKIMGQLSA